MTFSLRLFAAVLALAAAHEALAQGAIPPHTQTPLTPVYMAYSDQRTDHVYTVDYANYQEAINIHGYTPAGIIAYLESGPAPNTLPFRRFFNPAHSDHFYTWDQGEANYVLANGWYEEPDGGYIYTVEVPGSAPLYRLSRAPGGDHDHLYTMNYSEVQQRVATGWTYDGVAGYAYSTALPTITNGTILGVRPWLPGSHPRNKAFGLLYIPQSYRGKHSTTQVVDFDLTSYGMGPSGDHLGVMLRSQFRDDMWWPQNNSYYWGAGAAIGAIGFFCPGTLWNAAVELFDNPSIQRVFGANDQPNTCSQNLNEGVKYHVTIIVSDAGDVQYYIFYGWSFLAYSSANVAYAPGWSGPMAFKRDSTGVLIVGTEAGLNGNAYTTYVENLSISWH